MATYLLIVHQFTAQQVGKGKKNSLITQNPILCSKHVHLKATYLLILQQFTAQQVGKGGKEGTNFHSYASHKIKGNLPPESESIHSTASG